MNRIFMKGISVLGIFFRFLLNCTLILKPLTKEQREATKEVLYNNKVMPNVKRAKERVELSLPITLLDYKCELENISSSGVYLTVPTDDIERFSLETEAKVEVTATIKGIIVRKDKKSTRGHASRMGIALKFDEKPEHILPSFS